MSPSTRDRILDTALGLFVAHGYERTAMRDIAERLGVTKPALYHHFAGKADILFELHLRQHALAGGLLDEVETLPAGRARIDALPRLLDRFITVVDEHRELFELSQRNPSAFADLTHERHLAANAELGARVERVLADAELPPGLRVRIVCALGAVLRGLLDGGLTRGVAHDERIAIVRAAAAAALGVV